MAPADKSTDGPEITQAERRRGVVKRSLETLMRSNPQLYYQSASEVARAIHEDVKKGDGLSAEDREAMKKLSVRDIEVILAFH